MMDRKVKIYVAFFLTHNVARQTALVKATEGLLDAETRCSMLYVGWVNRLGSGRRARYSFILRESTGRIDRGSSHPSLRDMGEGCQSRQRTQREGQDRRSGPVHSRADHRC